MNSSLFTLYYYPVWQKFKKSQLTWNKTFRVKQKAELTRRDIKKDSHHKTENPELFEAQAFLIDLASQI